MTKLVPFETWFTRDPLWGDTRNLWRRLFNGDEKLELTSRPLADVVEDDESYLVKADVPGFAADDIDVMLRGDTLTIRGEKSAEEKREEETYHLVERRYGSFERSFAFPTPVESDDINAEMKDGVLEVRVMKRHEAKPSKIKVKAK